DEGDAGRLRAGLERDVVRLHARAMSDGRDRRLVESRTNLAATAADVALARVLAAVILVRSQPHEGRDRLTAALAQLREVGQQAARHLRAEADDRLQNFVAGLESGGTLDDGFQALFQILDKVLEVFDHPVLFATCSLLVQDLLAAKRDLRLERFLKKLAGFAALVIDDLGYVQQSREEMEVLFTLLAERYERGSVMLTSNLPFSQW